MLGSSSALEILSSCYPSPVETGPSVSVSGLVVVTGVGSLETSFSSSARDLLGGNTSTRNEFSLEAGIKDWKCQGLCLCFG
ncbi:hypothetical protein SESBI_35385 [Sesbania bispinosa]|nr:hypothetical protein SESBI_35385 [Sesbania bispinosa]